MIKSFTTICIKKKQLICNLKLYSSPYQNKGYLNTKSKSFTKNQCLKT